MATMEIYKGVKLIRREEIKATVVSSFELCGQVKKAFADELLKESDIRKTSVKIIIRDLNGRTEFRIRKLGDNGVEVFKY